jgi:hypothetical protein
MRGAPTIAVVPTTQAAPMTPVDPTTRVGPMTPADPTTPVAPTTRVPPAIRRAAHPQRRQASNNVQPALKPRR